MDINAVAQELKKEMDDAGINLATPLMMDLEIASFNDKPELPYTYQLKLMSDITLDYAGVFFPFAMVDPRRPQAADLIIRSLEKQGFLGVKMYPPLGYHPDPTSIYNQPYVNEELTKIYEYCNANQVPITTHCSKGGAYSDGLMHTKNLRKQYTNPASWENVVKDYPNLRLNLAHFGGDLLEINDNNESWAKAIIKLIKDYPNVYTDIAYHDAALNKKESVKYFSILSSLLEDDLVKDKILFGTDWSMTRHTWTESEYVQHFTKWADDEDKKAKLQQITFTNPLNFLFPNHNFPQRILNFYKANGKVVSDLPGWLIESMANLEI